MSRLKALGRPALVAIFAFVAIGVTLLHPAMLHYLDNDQNAVGRLNESYGRELLELHTLGVGSGYPIAPNRLARMPPKTGHPSHWAHRHSVAVIRTLSHSVPQVLPRDSAQRWLIAQRAPPTPSSAF